MPSFEMDYNLMKALYQAFDRAEEVLTQACDKMVNATQDAADTAFVGLVGQTYRDHAKDLTVNMVKFRDRLRAWHAHVTNAEQTMRQGDDAAAQDLVPPDITQISRM